MQPNATFFAGVQRATNTLRGSKRRQLGRGENGAPRPHIFWQRRICAEDVTTPYWYPFQTSSGAIREDRLVLPIPPGVHWKDVQAVAVPAVEAKRAQIVDQRPVKTNVPLKPRIRFE